MEATLTCPYCTALCLFRVVWRSGSQERYLRDGGDRYLDMFSAVMQCLGCDMTITALFDVGTDLPEVVEHWPKRVAGRKLPEVPERIAQAADEVHRCMQIGAIRAAGPLARSVIEAVAKDKGVTKGSVRAKIDDLHTRGLVREHVRDGAHEVRYFGNDMAHGDFALSLDEADVRLVIALMDEVLEEVYIAPARVQAARDARVSRKSSAGNDQAAKRI